MRAVRTEVRRDRTPELSMPQFRALAYVAQHEGCPLTDVAAHLGLTLPTASKMMDGLVDEGMVARNPDRQDRRKLKLNLSPKGRQKHESILRNARDFLAGKVDHLGEGERQQLANALRLLKEAFGDDVPGPVEGDRDRVAAPRVPEAVGQ
ncbi:MAG: MarR family winged helix-turn-helix transcriptional regulator [Verrucomicrobium sp.]